MVLPESKVDIQKILLSEWDNDPPEYVFISQVLPSSEKFAYLESTGCGNALAVFLEELEDTLANQAGTHWNTNSVGETEDAWELVGYDSLDHPVYTKFIILYYKSIA
jgi:hypothetical protein